MGEINLQHLLRVAIALITMVMSKMKFDPYMTSESRFDPYMTSESRFYFGLITSMTCVTSIEKAFD